METITLEYDVRNEQAREMIEIILSSGLAIRKEKVKSEKSEKGIAALPFTAGLWEDYDIDDRMLRAKAWGTDKKHFQ